MQTYVSNTHQFRPKLFWKNKNDKTIKNIRASVISSKKRRIILEKKCYNNKKEPFKINSIFISENYHVLLQRQ